MIHLRNIEKYFADRPIFNGINWHIRPSEKIGLCGENGAGKTTLLKFLAGKVEQDKGELHTAKGVQVGYLPQEGLEYAGRSLFDEVRSALDQLLAMEQRLTELETLIASDHRQSDMDTYAEIQEQFRHQGGYEMEAEIGRVLQGLGFSKDEWEKPCEHFSGGWQMRIALAKLLLKRPDLLLLDEPTNHLDLPARDWLEGYLANYPYTVILVSHDRFFLDQVVTRIVEIWNGSLASYPGSYSHYLKARDEQVTALQNAKEKQDEEIAKMEAFIGKFRYNANKATLVQSRIKQLDKIERIVVPPKRKKIGFSFPPPPKGGRLALQLAGVEQGYGDNTVLADVDLTIEKGNRIALVGANGAGKSTLMRILSGAEAPRTGEREEGHNLSLAYFAQDQARTLNPDKTVLQEISDAAPFDMVPKLRTILGSFLFSGDDVDKRVSMLSGGERNRLALAILLLRPANLLLLDEPTNHLDLQSKEVLLAALKSYSGTLVFVSHDRYFVDHLAERVVHIADGAADSHLGNYADFLRRMEEQGDGSHSDLRVESSQNEATTKVAAPSGKEQYQQSKEEKKQRRKLEKRCAELEAKIAVSEESIAKLEAEMAVADYVGEPDKWRQMSAEYERLKDELEDLYNDWEEAQLALAG